MVMRVTQGLLYNSMIGGMNRSLSDLMESNIQSSSQKRVNRPSDDPVGMARILHSRDTLSKLSTYEANTEQAMGWLSLADGVLGSGDGSVQTVLTRIKVLAEQAATGTLSDDNRLQISYEVRQHFEQIIQLANTTFEGRQIFGGHKTDQPSYVQGLAVTCKDSETAAVDSLNNAPFNVSGALDSTLIVQAVTSDEADRATYRYSADGGATWQKVENGPTVDADGMCVINAGGVEIKFPAKKPDTSSYGVTGVPPGDPDSGPENASYENNGTWLYIRPTAVYQGDDHDTQVLALASYGTAAQGTAEGSFSRDVAVRIDAVDSTNSIINYSYSVDDGANWIPASAPLGSGGTATNLLLPGGYLTFDSSNTLSIGDQFVVHPHRADVTLQIGDADYIAVNMVGKDIFGGYYNYPGDSFPGGTPATAPINYPVRVDEGRANLFETLGDLIAALETNNQTGCQEALPKIDEAMKLLLTRTAEVGGRENRLTTTQAAIVMRQFSEEDNLSAIEDVDIYELTARLAQQQTAYTSVLKSSSMIMQMSLVNFL